MRYLRRLTAIATLAVSLSMTLFGTSSACAMSNVSAGSVSAAGMSDGGMAGMHMPEAPSPNGSSEHDSSPCSLPWAPGDCHGLEMCPLAVVAESRLVLDIDGIGVEGVPMFNALEPRSPTFVPESPPPRG